MAPRNPQSSAYLTPTASSPRPKRTPKVAVDHRLHQQEATDPLARLVDELGGGDDLALARQPDDPVAQLLALQEHEDDQDDGQGSSPRYSSSGLRNEVNRDIQAGLCGSTITAVGRRRRSAPNRRSAPRHCPRPRRVASPAERSRPGLAGIRLLVDVGDHLLDLARVPRGFLDGLDLVLDVCRYLGSSWSRLLICSVTSQPTPPSAVAAQRTTRITAGVRGSPCCRSQVTNGLSRKVRKPASATGMKTDWAQYRVTITTTPTTVPVSVMIARCHPHRSMSWSPRESLVSTPSCRSRRQSTRARGTSPSDRAIGRPIANPNFPSRAVEAPVRHRSARR